ncbi:aromatic aminotransferase Aro8 [Penicillium odoratum]|uniref:aromatic aminotransferase Aro8 n=1 Tax=Penicillium odoratum TaxID=1167516 RepID=UPI002548ABFC|nr:aromatic aminotransferase Aro8 [Penicillium odoratum]KAJ5769268.1 aromatic aminotransferase Aro8 [Penicillium odoratum]
MFKSLRCFRKPSAQSFEHRLNLEARSRGAATLKAAGAELNGDVISLGTGRPSPEYFPFLKMSLDFPTSPGLFEDRLDYAQSKSIGKYDIEEKKSTFDLAVSLNYGYSAGSEQLIRFLTEHVDVVHNPPYSDWQCALTAGTTSAIDCIFRTFCDRGDFVITEEYTYSATIEAARPLGLRTVGVPMDDQGMSSSKLDSLLSEWDPFQRGGRKPFLLYLIPTGQNPTGVTQSLQRRREIYAVAQRHDLYIIEDDPYYFLRLGSEKVTTPKEHHSLPLAKEAVESFLHDLIPSFLSLDSSGRVLRLDSTSKILAPGLRCSWMTGSAEIISRILYLHDATTVCPSGLSQLAIHTLLDEVWGHEGFIEWLIHLQNKYTQRLNVMLESCETYFPPKICSWKTPKAGMFHWIKIDWRAHPLAPSTAKSESETMLEIEDRIYSRGLKMGVMCCKGSAFRADGAHGCEMFFRVTFASASVPQISEAIKRFGKAICEEFKINS